MTNAYLHEAVGGHGTTVHVLLHRTVPHVHHAQRRELGARDGEELEDSKQ